MSVSTQSLGTVQFSQTTNICSKLTNVILDADIDNSSFLVKTGGNNVLYIDKYGNAGFNTTSPGAQIEVASGNGSCMRMRYGASEFYADMSLSNTGDLSINPSSGVVKTNASMNIANHNGTTIGLHLGGALVAASADQLNYTIVTPGTASISKALVLDNSGNISNINSLTATSLTGQIQTASQPNITSVGTLTALSISGVANSTNATASTSSITGGLLLAGGVGISNATNATSATNGGSFTTAGGAAIAQALWVGGLIRGTLTTASTTNATGSLLLAGGVGISNTTNATSATNGGSFTTAGGAAIAQALWVGGLIRGTLTTASTTNATGSLLLAGGVGISNATNATSATNGGSFTTAGGAAIAQALWVGGLIRGTLTTASTSSATGSLMIAGGVGISNATNATSATNGGSFTTAGGAAIAQALWVGGLIRGTLTTASTSNATGSLLLAGGIGISNATNATSTTNGGSFTTAGGAAVTLDLYVGGGIFGTLQTAAQTNITSVGTLSTLTVSGGITGTLQTAAQTNITSVGTLTTLAVSGIASSTDATASTSSITGSIILSGGIGISNITNATSSTNGGSFTTAGGAAVAQALYVGNGIYGTLQTAAQANITSVGTLTTLAVSGITNSTNATASTSSITGGLTLSGGLGIANTTNAISTTNGGSFTTAGGAAVAQALYVGGGMYGTLQTPAQPNITAVGTLSSLTVSGTTELQTKLAAIYGGTDNDTYTTGDILVASSSTTLAKVSVPPASNGCFLVADIASANGVGWSMNILYNYHSMGDPVYNSNTNYTIPYFIGRNAANTNYIQIESTILDLSTNGINGLVPTSADLTGVIYPNPTSVTLTGTSSAFTTDLVAGDLINVGGTTRKVVSITDDTTLVVDSIFSTLNRWSLTTATISATQKMFGTSALRVAGALGYALNTIGSGYGFDATSDAWTIEMFVYLSAVNANLVVCNSTVGFSFSLAYASGTNRFNISLGQGGATFNIANAVTITSATAVVANTWYHLAVVYSGTDYRVYFKGTVGATIASAAKITATAFNALRFGSNAVTNFNGYIDEARISDIARYSTTFTPTTAAFTSDANTISLQHFDNATITLGDDKSTSENTFTYTRNGSLYSGALNYVYALNHPTAPAYIVSTRPSVDTLVDLPAGYSNLDCVQIDFAIPVQVGNIPYSVFRTGHHCCIVPMPLIVNASSNTAPVTYSLAPFVPAGCKKIDILITHTHVGTLSTGIRIGPTAALYQTFATAAVAGQTYLMITVPVSTTLTFDAYLTVLASTTNFSINLIGFYS